SAAPTREAVPQRGCSAPRASAPRRFTPSPPRPLAPAPAERHRTAAARRGPSVAHRGVLPAFKSHSAPRPPQPLRSVLLGRLRSRLATMRPESCPLSARSRVDEEEAAYPLEETSAQRASAGAS